LGYRDILVYVDGSPGGWTALALATELAMRFDAYLIGLHVVGLAMPSYHPIYGVCGPKIPPIPPIDQIRDSELLVAHKSEERFRDQLQSHGARGEWRQCEGMVAATVAHEAKHVDLAIVTQVDHANPPAGTRRYVPQEVLLSSGRPVLMVPCTGSRSNPGRNILVGWNGSREAVRAVNDAMPLLKSAEKVTVLAVVPRHEREGEAVEIEGIARHLTRHGVKVANAQCTQRQHGTSSTLLSYAADIGADLIVIGGYGHSRLRALVLGGVSRRILRRTTTPVLFSH
jgi:nucleotide-binding universal stress UspA family protein